MKTRVITSLVGLGILFVVMLFFSTPVFNIVIALFCLVAIHEVFMAFDLKKTAFLYWGFVPYTLLVMFSDYRLVRRGLLPLSYIFVLYLAICVIRHSSRINFARLGGMVFYGCVLLFCFYSFIYIKQLLPRASYGYDAIYFIFLSLGIAWGGDTAAFFVGRSFGKHKLAPIVSPNKTVEGAVGGVLGSMLLGVIVTAVYSALHGSLVGIGFGSIGPGFYLMIMFLGAVGSLLGIVGDLFASVVKRQCGIKDYGTIFPGHGGIMDRFDSVLFIVPLVAMVATAAVHFSA